MDIKELFVGCRKGDLPKIKLLIEHNDLELNVRDNWDSTPLYYACLCGHIEVVQFLLENGAKCQANTFDGERCLYGALTDEIRTLLWNFKVVSSKQIKRDTFDEFLRKCYEEMEYADISFKIDQQIFKAHKCILSARSSHLRNMLCRKLQCDTISIALHSMVTPEAFNRVILQYLYTGRFESPLECLQDCVYAVKYFKVPKLLDEIEKAIRKAESFASMKPGTNKITTIVVEENSNLIDLQNELGTLFWHGLPPELSNPLLAPRDGLYLSQLSDVCFNVEGHHFLCHKTFICGRSGYFKALLADHFSEKKFQGTIPLYDVKDIAVDIFVAVLRFIYQNTTELTKANAFDMMCAADMFLLPGLKRFCANFVGNHLEESNIIDVLKMSRLLDQPRLEEQCTKFIAYNLSEMSLKQDFRNLIMQDAKEVKHRHETDSIGVIDDVRFHITRNIQTFAAIEQSEAKLAVVDKLLQELQLEA